MSMVGDRQDEITVRDRPGEIADTPMTDSAFIEAIYRAQWAPLVRLALVMTGDRGKAEDIVHDVFVRLATRPTPQDPPSYLRRMVVNATRDHHRRIRIERRFVHVAPPPAVIPEVDEVILIVQRLPNRQRQALALRFYADMSLEQIAQLLECPTGTVKSLIHRGIEGLRKELET
jgi:DNA-directed RNA polymerase specialized sigma24 family protein